MTKANILIVEDDRIVAEGIKRSLKKLGFGVSGIVSYGEQVFEKVKACHPDLVLMDIMLKGEMNGTEAADQIQSKLNIPVVYLTAYTDENVLDRAKVTEPFGYVVKPFEDRELNTAIEIALYKHKMETKLRESEAWLSATLKSIGDAVIATDAKGCVTYMNPVAESLTGLNQEAAVGKPLTDVFNIINKETRNSVESPIERVLREGVIVGLANHTVLVSKDGTEYHIDDSGAPIRDDHGDITGCVLVFRNITEKRQGEEALRESEEKFSKAFHSSAALMAISTLEDGRLLEINDMFEQTLEYKRDEVIGKTSAELGLFTDIKQRDTIKKMMKERGYVRDLEITARTKSGAVRNGLFSGSIIKLAGETHWLTVMQDITKRKQVEEALRESEERLRFTTDQTPGTLWTTDNELRFTLSVGAGLSSLGLEPGQVVGMSLYEFFGTDDPDHHSIKMHRQALEGRSIRYEDHWEGHDYETYMEPFRDSKGNVNGVIGISFDITERKKSEEKLHESETRYRTLFNSASDGIAIIKGDVHIECNPKLAELFGCPIDQIIGQSPAKFSPPTQPDGRDSKEKVLEKINRALQGEPQLFEWQHRKSDGTLYNAEVSLKCFEIDSEKYLHAFDRDITERKQAEEKRKELESQLRQAQKMEAIGTLAGGIAHDFNNILTPIIVQTELSLLDLTDESPIWFNLQEVMKASHRAKDLVAQILAFSRQTDQQPVPMMITPIVREAIKLLRASLPTTIDIRFDLREGSDTVMADPTQIHQVLMNLCTNAGHAMRETGGILQVGLSDIDVDSDFAVKHTGVEPGPYLKLTVSDTGHGISSEVMDRIFDPFFTTKERTEGTGMGLAVVLGIISGYGGAITADSEPGKGAIFNVFLPRTRTKVLEKAELIKQLPTGNERILVVDDEKSMVDTLKKMLDRLGYQVVERTSSIEALEAFRSAPDNFDLVITDMTMPNLTGDKLAQELLAIRSDIPIILCTGFSERISKEKATEVGIKDFLMKPVAMSEMATTIRRVFDNMAV